MEINVLYKFVFEDMGLKVVKGFFIEEDDFCIKVRPHNNNEIIILGKRAIVKIQKVELQ